MMFIIYSWNRNLKKYTRIYTPQITFYNFARHFGNFVVINLHYLNIYK